MAPRHHDTERRWLVLAQRVSDAYGLVLLSTVLTFLVVSMLPAGPWAHALGVAMASGTAVLALASSNVRPRYRRRALAVSAVATALAVLAAVLDTAWPLAIAQTIVALLTLIAAGTILRRVLLAPTVTFRTILGALTTYTMLGPLFAFVYMATEVAQGHPFFASGEQYAPGEFMFFSFTTLTTTGYGDLVPGGQPGESLAILEMLSGQIFLVTLVAGLVSLWRPGRDLGTAKADGPSGFRRMRDELREDDA